MPENAADVAHLNYLHGPGILSGVDLRETHNSFHFLTHQWHAAWEPQKTEETKHLSVLTLLHRLCIFGVPVSIFDLNVTATQVRLSPL